ncbi:sensor histidine kinase [candidate division KSB1 bacterium]|nr:MAG: sensor histidine kinase [candidate division KSB1 bacterium]
MQHISDDFLLQELKRRFEENNRTIAELNEVKEKLLIINQKLSDSEALKSNFLSNIRNEINNPLTAILGIAQYLMGNNKIDTKTVSEMTRMIYAEAFNLDFQLRTIFAAAEIEAGEVYLHISKVDITELILRTVQSFKHIALKKQVEIKCDINLPEQQGQPFLFTTDSEKIHLIFSNLLSNAIEYGQTSDKIDIKVRLQNNNLCISVKDYGIGIDKADHEKIFDRFVQLDHGLTKAHQGHGLGLSVVKNTIEFLEGTLTLESEKNKGCHFLVSIPEAQALDNDESFSLDANEELF